MSDFNINMDEKDFTYYKIINDYTLKRISKEDEDSLQKLCDRCTDFYEIVEGRKPPKDAGHEILFDLPPNKGYDDKFVFGILNIKSELNGVIEVIRDYPEKGEWLIGLMMLDPNERGKGLGKNIHDCLVDWVSNRGADKLRIGVVEDNDSGYRFWNSLGYKEIKRVNSKLGDKENIVIVMNYLLKHPFF